MNRNIIAGALFIIVVLIAAGMFSYLDHSGTAPATGIVEPQSQDFSADGNVVRNDPGMNPDVWYLVYEKPGAPALSVELDLNSVPGPYIAISQGERVHVEGQLRENVVVVSSIEPAASANGMHIKLYFYDPALDQGPGGAQCSGKGLVAVDRVIPQSSTPLADSIKLLLQGARTDLDQGLITEFPLPGVSLTSATITSGVATLTFADPQSRTSGGSCRVAIMWGQIAATAKQFDTVRSVQFKPDTLFQP